MPSYKRIVNKEKKEASVYLFGEIGEEVNGNEIAHDLTVLGEQMDTIHLHINSGGGSVFQGFSIVSAILSARAYLNSHVDGVAASMAAVVAVSCDKVSMQDYAKLMIHDPFFTGKNSSKLSPKDAKALDSIRDALRTILSRRGCDKDKVSSLMSEETWFSAEEAKTAGLVDEVVSTPRKEELTNLSVPDLINRIINEYQPNKNSNMNEIAKALGLPEDATKEQIINAIKEKEKAFSTAENALVDHFIVLGVKNGIVTEKNKEKMQRLAKADFSLFAGIVSEASTKDETEKDDAESLTRKPKNQETGRLSAALAELKALGNAKGGGKEGKTQKTYDWYQKHDVAALKRLEVENPVAFKRLLDEYESNYE